MLAMASDSLSYKQQKISAVLLEIQRLKEIQVQNITIGF